MKIITSEKLLPWYKVPQMELVSEMAKYGFEMATQALCSILLRLATITF